jgi:hypothetical protein
MGWPFVGKVFFRKPEESNDLSPDSEITIVTPDTDTDCGWINRIARIPWWVYVAIAIVVFLLLIPFVPLLKDRVPTHSGFVLPKVDP